MQESAYTVQWMPLSSKAHWRHLANTTHTQTTATPGVLRQTNTLTDLKTHTHTHTHTHSHTHTHTHTHTDHYISVSLSTCTSWFPLISFIHCCCFLPTLLLRRTFRHKRHRFIRDWMPFLSPDQQRQSTEGNTSRDSSSRKIINSKHRFFIYLLIHPSTHPFIRIKKMTDCNNKRLIIRTHQEMR